MHRRCLPQDEHCIPKSTTNTLFDQPLASLELSFAGNRVYIYTTIGFCIWNLFALVTLILVFRKRNQKMDWGELVEGAPEGYRYSL